jgi:glutathione synthase/RimK-type ligase-like ATP-grasp enzyme
VADIPLPPEVEARCRDLSKRLRLPVAGIDLRRTPDGEWYCFEVNPSPGFTYYESKTGQPIAAAIAGLLAAAALCKEHSP